MNGKELETLNTFFKDNKSAGKLSAEAAIAVKKLWDEYRLPIIVENDWNDCAIVKADFGALGSLIIEYISSTEFTEPLKYASDSSDYFSVKTTGRSGY